MKKSKQPVNQTPLEVEEVEEEEKKEGVTSKLNEC
jgi:hypothetical protein